jgi:hypothetical protein
MKLNKNQTDLVIKRTKGKLVFNCLFKSLYFSNESQTKALTPRTLFGGSAALLKVGSA